MPAPMTGIDEALKQWATPHQIKIIDAINLFGGVRAAAKEMGVNHSTLVRGVERIKQNAAAHGYSPEHNLKHIIPAPFVAKGHSTYYDKDGVPTQQWVKSKLDDQAYLELIQEAVAAFIQDVPHIPAVEGPTDYDTDVIPWIQIGDAHLGMLAHEAETGENFDLKIAERELCAGISMLIDDLPTCERVVINDCGDFTHYENFTATTEASGHALDYDSRFPKMITIYSRMMRFIVDRALEKFKHVDVIVNQGNHSRTNDIWMAELLRVAYGHTGRVNVLNNDTAFIAYRMGKTLVMTHHSDKCRPKDLVHVLATDFAKDWGETDFRYIDIGHIHHGMSMKEHPGVRLESWNQLAAGDKWAHDKGYRSHQSVSAVLRSRTYGEIGRLTLPVEKIRDSIIKSLKGSRLKYVPQRKMAFVA